MRRLVPCNQCNGFGQIAIGKRAYLHEKCHGTGKIEVNCDEEVLDALGRIESKLDELLKRKEK